MKFILEIIGTTIFVLVEIYVLGIIYWATKKEHLNKNNNEISKRKSK
jgi:cbb3-type cytochrome oxidase subunit 3